MKLGAQLWTVRDYCATLDGLEESLRRVANMGYTAVQLSGVCEYQPEWMAEKLKENGLVAPITHFPHNRTINDTEKTIEFHKTIGANYIGVGCIPCERNSEAIEAYMDRIAPALKKISAAGMKYMFHNHNFEFERIDGELVLDRICSVFPTNEFGVTMDTYWVQAGGGDPAVWLHKLAGRTDCVHLKDMMYSNADKAIRMCSVGEGNMNFDSIISACLETGVKYAFVERDECYGENPFDSLRRSREYIVSRYGIK